MAYRVWKKEVTVDLCSGHESFGLVHISNKVINIKKYELIWGTLKIVIYN